MKETVYIYMYVCIYAWILWKARYTIYFDQVSTSTQSL